MFLGVSTTNRLSSQQRIEKKSGKCFLYGGCTHTVKKKNWSQMTKNAQREGLVNCCNL